jgi:hypothetical protein
MNGSMMEIKVYPLGYLKCIFEGYDALCEQSEYKKQGWVCGECKYDIHYIHCRYFSDEYNDDDHAGYEGLDDSYWECPHMRCFFGEVPHPVDKRLDGSKSWFDIIMESYAEQGIDIVAEEKKRGIAREKEWNDPRYKKEEEMKKYFNNQTDKKRSAGKKWIKEVEKPCKYALRAYTGEDVTVYKFKNPVTAKKDTHFYAECWQWECTGPITGKVYDLHICNCVHPGEKDAKGNILWKDTWITDPMYVAVYDRLEDWYKWDYSFTDKKWTYDAERVNSPLTNRKKGLVPGTADGGLATGRCSPTLGLEGMSSKPWSSVSASGSVNSNKKMGGRFGHASGGADADTGCADAGDGWHSVSAPTAKAPKTVFQMNADKKARK